MSGYVRERVSYGLVPYDTTGTVLYRIIESNNITEWEITVPLRYGRNSTICVFSYHDTIKLYASKKTNEVWKYGFFYSYSFIVLLMYHNSKNSPVCGLCHGISFTCDVRLCTVNIPQSLTNTNSTLPYLW